MATKNYFLVTATYAGKSKTTTISKTDSSGHTCETIKVSYGSTSKYYGAGTVPMSCSGKYMTGDIEISLGSTSALAQIEMGCKSKVMSSDVTIDIREISGSNYDIITDTQYWTVPAGVTAINVCCVGGGGGGGGSYEITSTSGSSSGSSGGGGGYVVTGSFSGLTAGEQFLCSIGKGGTGGSLWYSGGYAKGCGTAGETTTIQRINTSTSVSAAGGGAAGWSSSSSQYAGSGGTGGGTGATSNITINSDSDSLARHGGGAGGTELVRKYGTDIMCPENNKYGYKNFQRKKETGSSPAWYYVYYSGQAGAGQSATTLFNGVYYGHGGGGGAKGESRTAETKDWWTDGGDAFAGGGIGCGMPSSYACGGNGSANTGGGGGGAGGSDPYTVAGAGGDGGSGVIIITW